MTKEEDEARSTAVMKMMDKPGSVAVADEEDKAKNVIVLTVTNEVNEPGSAAMA